MRTDCWRTLLSFLKEVPVKTEIVVMPDFFFDRLVNLKCDMSTFASMVGDVARRKGGSIDGISQEILRGGNAINTASALAALGAKVTPIICTDRLGFRCIKFHFKKYRIDLSHVRIVEKPSLTTALELKTQEGKTNVMLRDLGQLIDFGPSDLSNKDYELIENADYVCVFNWAGTRKHGTALAETVFRRTKEKGRGITYYDPADPTPNKAKIPELMEKILKSKIIDILSLNENEAKRYAEILIEDKGRNLEKLHFEENGMGFARILAKNLSARIDLHTSLFSATLNKKKTTCVPVFDIKALRATGAGDAWNAGNIMGDAAKLSEEARLTLANAVSAYYLSNPEGIHPTRKKLLKFIEMRCGRLTT